MKEIYCLETEQGDVVSRYLAGALPDSEAELFEEHYFGCDRCSAELEQAAELRATFRRPVAAPVASRPGSSQELWSLLAAVAAVAMIGLGLRQLARNSEILPSGSAFRGAAEEAFALTVIADSNGRVRLTWPAQDDARVYAVQILSSDGRSLWKQETVETNLLLDQSVLPLHRSDAPILAEVEALDAMRSTVARSTLSPLPSP